MIMAADADWKSGEERDERDVPSLVLVCHRYAL